MPSPGTPISELIALNVQTTVEAIAAGASYTNTIAGVDRPNPSLGQQAADKRCLLVQGNPVQVAERPQMHVEWQHPFQLLAYVCESEASSTAIDTRLNTIRADIERALMVDQTRGGYATRTVIDQPEFGDISTTAHEGTVSVNFSVFYRTLWNNPYAQS